MAVLESRLLTGSLLDFERLFLGKHLGTGAFRAVYEHGLDPKAVIKAELNEECFHNVNEWIVWNDLRFRQDAAKWLAPCIAISPGGHILVQARTKPITKAQMPTKVPRFLTDIKTDNWGLYRGRPVCHDYALVITDYSMKRKASRCSQ